MIRTTIEIAGVPASGKTTAAHRLQKRLLREGHAAVVVREAAEIAPFPRERKRDWRFNAWTMFHVISEMIRLAADTSDSVAILDRGLFDASAWIRWHFRCNQLDRETALFLESVCFYKAWQRQVDVVCVLEASFDVIVERRHGRLGQIVNPETLAQLMESYSSVRNDQSLGLKAPVFFIPTDDKSPEEVEGALFDIYSKAASNGLPREL
jgi:tRNA uridine 5-carbamoylmethylation protein Kti12